MFDEQRQKYTTLSLFPEDRPVPAEAVDSVQVKLSEMKLRRARPYGNCWLGCELWRQLELDRFWEQKLAYEAMDGNTSDKTTLRGFLAKIEELYGKARRVWLMDRGVPTEAVLQEMRQTERQMVYLVGTPKARVTKYEKQWLELAWHKVRDSVEVKLFGQDGELYVLAKSEGRQQKEIAIRRKKLARLLRKLRRMGIICCAPIWWRKIRRCCGIATCSSPRSRRPSNV